MANNQAAAVAEIDRMVEDGIAALEEERYEAAADLFRRVVRRAPFRHDARDYLAFALEQPKYFDFAFLTPDRGITGLAEELARPLWNTFRMSIEQITACMDSGLFERGDPLEISIMMWAEVHGLVTLFRHGRFGPDETMFREIYGKSVQRLLRGLEAR